MLLSFLLKNPCCSRLLLKNPSPTTAFPESELLHFSYCKVRLRLLNPLPKSLLHLLNRLCKSSFWVRANPEFVVLGSGEPRNRRSGSCRTQKSPSWVLQNPEIVVLGSGMTYISCKAETTIADRTRCSKRKLMQYVKGSFVKDNINTELEEQTAILDSGGNQSWSVIFRHRHNQTYFNRLRDFLEENNVKVGDVCTFELVDKKNRKFRASISRSDEVAHG